MSKWLALSLALIALILSSCGSNLKKDPQLPNQQERVVAEEEFIPAQTALNPAEYIAWMRHSQNKLSVNFIQGDIAYSFQYTPIDLVTLRHLGELPVSLGSFESERSSLDGFQYFTLTIATNSSRDIISYHTSLEKDKEVRSKYYSYDMQHDLKLLDGKDTLRCLMFHHEMTYGISPYTNFLLGFELRDGSDNADTKDKILIFKNRMDGTEPIMLTIRATALNQIPKLIIK